MLAAGKPAFLSLARFVVADDALDQIESRDRIIPCSQLVIELMAGVIQHLGDGFVGMDRSERDSEIIFIGWLIVEIHATKVRGFAYQ